MTKDRQEKKEATEADSQATQTSVLAGKHFKMIYILMQIHGKNGNN